jgi:hypothetical protein
MMALKRIAVVASLAAYLVATTAIHALHDHSGNDHCCHGLHGLCSTTDPVEHDHAASAHDDATHDGSPIHRHHKPANHEDSCFACRILAAKSIAPVAVAIIETSEIIRPVDPPQRAFTPLVQPDRPLSRGPPAA